MYVDDDSNRCRGGLPVPQVGYARLRSGAALGPRHGMRAGHSVRGATAVAAVLCCLLGASLASAQSAPAAEWIVATVEGNTYRATQVRELPDGSVQIQERSGRQVTVPASRLAKMWPDADSQNQPADLTVRTTCVRSQLEGAIVRDLVFAGQTGSPIRARIVHLDPGQSLFYQRLESTTTEARAWADVEEILRPPGLLDPCRVAPPPPEPVWQPSPGSPHRPTSRGGVGLIIAGSIILGHGLPALLLSAAGLGQDQSQGLSGGMALVGGTIMGGAATTLGIALLIPGVAAYSK